MVVSSTRGIAGYSSSEDPKMGKNKHKRHHKSEAREEDYDSPPTIIPKLILKVGGATPERADSPALSTHAPSLPILAPSAGPSHLLGGGEQYFAQDRHHPTKHKKKKKKKEKKREKEKKHKHHHKEKRKRDYSSLENREHYYGRSVSTSPELGPSNKRVCLDPDLDPELPVLVRQVSPSPPRDIQTFRQKTSNLTKLLDFLLPELEKKDVNNFFQLPVNDAFAPGYSRIIHNPMDFSTIRTKIDEGRYDTLAKFRADFSLICTNCMLYNMPDTVYHKAAKKLLQQGQRILSPERLRLLAEHNPLMHQLSTAELGFQIREDLVPAEFTVEDEREVSMVIQEIRGCVKRPPGRFEAIPDDMSPEDILEQVKAAAAGAKKKLAVKRPGSHVGYLRQKSDGSTMFSVVTTVEEGDKDRPITLASLIGKVKQETVTFQDFREEKKNQVVVVKSGDNAPRQVHESTFANLSKEETDMVYSTYGDHVGVEYAESIKNFSRNCEYATFIVDHLLDILTGNEHRKTSKHIEEQKVLRGEEAAVASAFPSPSPRIDLDNLKTLEDVGIDMSFLDNLKKMNTVSPEQGVRGDQSVQKGHSVISQTSVQ